MLTISEEMIAIAKKIQKAGGTLYLVGGALRNYFLNLPIKDEDYCITGFNSEKFQKLFPEAKIQGKSFPVFIINKKEIALARKEKKSGKGHKEFEFQADETITIQEDLKRRDITINSIAQNVLTGEIIDPFNGQADIKNKIIRKTSNAFSEDPLRVYRIARFAAILDFNVDPNTLCAMEELKQELNTLSKERIFTEFQKALESNKPSIFFETLKKANVLEVHFPEIANLIGKTQPVEYHPEGDSYNHTMITVDNSTQLTKNLSIRYSCLVHDLGKGATPKEKLPHHYGHDTRGVKTVETFSNRIGVPSNWKKCGKTACKWHMKAGIFNQMTLGKKVDLIEKVSKTILGLEGLKIVVACDRSRLKSELQENYNTINFDTLGKKCLEEVNGKLIQKNYQNLQGEKLAQKLHEERVKWLKIN